MTFPWQNNSFPWWFLSFFNLWKKKQPFTVINGNSSTHPGFWKDESLTVIISRPWGYICQADIYINTAQVEPLFYDGSFNLKIISWQNSLTIPWHDITFPDMGQMAKVPWHFFQNSLTCPWHGENFVFPWHVATLQQCSTPFTLIIGGAQFEYP